jgi:hypothetical protein
MMPTELLQQIGLNKYEAEAYTALLTEGPLTGYELGKHSAVPLSRSYEILERLTQKGLALVQPADPPRYAAADPAAFVARTRAAQTATLDALAAALTTLPRAQHVSDFWIVRGRDAIVRHVADLIDAATTTISLAGSMESFDTALTASEQRGCRLSHQPSPFPESSFALLLDDSRCVIGTLMPAASCQAVTSTNPALLAALQALAPAAQPQPGKAMPTQSPAPSDARALDWLDWETRKHRRLLGLADHEAA